MIDDKQAYLSRPATEYGRGPVTNTMPAEIPMWAWYMIAAVVLVLWL